MSDFKMLIWIILALAALVAMWWFGWFGPITNEFLQIKKHTTY